jgi:hypothetical protein
LCGITNRPAPKLRSSLPAASNFITGAKPALAQLSNWNAWPPGGVLGLVPQRYATHSDSPSWSMATALRVPQVRPSGSTPQGAVVW